MSDEPTDEPTDGAVEIPLTGDLDLHPFAPRDIPSLVEEYVRACRARGVLQLRLAHGRGTGVQRAVVRRVLRGMREVVSFADAPPAAGAPPSSRWRRSRRRDHGSERGERVRARGERGDAAHAG